MLSFYQGTSESNYIRNTIVDASQTLGNITASYELRLTTTDVNVTVHVKNPAPCAEVAFAPRPKQSSGTTAEYTDILRFWQMHNLGVNEIGSGAGYARRHP